MYLRFPVSFFNALGGSPMEMAVVLLAILLLFGAKSLPNAMRAMGRWSEQLRRVSRDLQRELQDVEEPFHRARLEWEEQTKDFTVSAEDMQEKPVEPDEPLGEPDAGYPDHLKQRDSDEV